MILQSELNKDEFNTQEKVEKYFQIKEENENNQNIKHGLFDSFQISSYLKFLAPTGNNFISELQWKRPLSPS